MTEKIHKQTKSLLDPVQSRTWNVNLRT